MTILGKLLIFLNLIIGIGVAVYSSSLYTNRPGWYVETKDGGIDKGNAPLDFKGMAADIDSQTKAAYLASASWGTQYKALTASEALRSERHLAMFGTLPNSTAKTGKGLIDFAKEGTPVDSPNKGGGFLNLVEDPITKLLNLSPDLKTLDAKSFKQVVVHGPNDLPLKGTETLLEQFTLDNTVVLEQAAISYKLRKQLETLGGEIVVAQNQVYKHREIRDNLTNQANYLANFEVNATLNRETYNSRKRQLLERLAPFRSMEKK